MKIKVAEATPKQLDRLVAVCEGNWDFEPDGGDAYSTDWGLGGPIIEREGIELKRGYGKPLLWAAFAYDCHNNVRTSTGKAGPTPLVAAMRCYVASRLGDEVEIQEELT